MRETGTPTPSTKSTPSAVMLTTSREREICFTSGGRADAVDGSTTSTRTSMLMLCKG